MKIFWWQAGLHIEPENFAEIEALILLWDSTKKTSIGAEGAGSGRKTSGCGPSASSSRVREKLVENIIFDK